jgi:hypothetical protein
MQELIPWFRPVDVVIVYLREVEEYSIPEALSTYNPSTTVAYQLHQIGYSTDLVNAPRFVLNRYRSYKEQLAKFLAFLSKHTPLRLRGLPSSGLRQVTLTIPGPITREYTFINQRIPSTIQGIPNCWTRQRERMYDR